MASTSLSEQLQKLSAPQTAIYKDDKKKASLLFDPKEAALKDRDTFYEIGRSGLNELIALYEGFRYYDDTLFGLSSKDFERGVQTKEVNLHLDQTIEKFLLQLSPYFLLQSAHKATEWLVNRYQIHLYNQDAIMALILPYHETKIFVRFLQILDIKSPNNRWNWLRPVQKRGITLSKQVLYTSCAAKGTTLQFISKATLRYAMEFGERATQLNTVFAFFCSTAIGAINVSKVTEMIVSVLLPTLMTALESTIDDFRSSAYIILGYLSSKANIKEDTLNEILSKLVTTEIEFTHDMALLINIIYTHQTHLNRMSSMILSNISVDTMSALCMHLKLMVTNRINIQPVVLAFLSGVLSIIQSNSEEYKRFRCLPEILIDEVDLKQQQPEKIIKCILGAFKAEHGKVINKDEESDLEIIDDDDFSHKVVYWFSSFLKSVEKKYPQAFDKVMKVELSTGMKKKRQQLSKILSFKPAISHEVGGTYLFENLNSVVPELRVEAVNYVNKHFDTLKTENIDFLKECILSRFSDSSSEVIAALLSIPSENLNEVMTEEDVTSTFINILSKTGTEWSTVIKQTIIKFCDLDSLSNTQEVILALIPYLFPYDENSKDIMVNIINSKWGRKFELTKVLQSKSAEVKNDVETLKENTFKYVFEDNHKDLKNILDIEKLNKNSTVDISVYLLLKSVNLKNATVEEITEILNLLLESVENREIVSSTIGESFCSAIIPEVIMLARKDRIMFEVVEHIFKKMIEALPVKNVSKPWCNVCESPEIILIRRIYEICVAGCSIPTYRENYAALLQRLLAKYFNNPQQKFEFIANFACGHILYASDPKDVISPELQLRSLKLLMNFLAVQKDFKWMPESEVIVLMVLFNVNNPLTSVRDLTITFIEQILDLIKDTNQIYIKFLKELLSHKQELLMDNEQIKQVLKTTLTQQNMGDKIYRKNLFLKLANILSSDIPAHIKSGLTDLLSEVNNTNAFTYYVASLQQLEQKLKENNPKFVFDIYSSNLFKNVYQHINEKTISASSKPQVWNSLESGLKEYRECILIQGQVFQSPCVLILKQIDENVFKNVPEEKSKTLVNLICSAGALSNNPSLSSAASKVMKKINIGLVHFKHILEAMVHAVDPADNLQKKKKSSVSMLSHQLVETDVWKIGVALLEYVQNKKKMVVNNSFVTLLFQVLNKCLRFEEQSYVEYTKQLILSSLWYYCKTFADSKDQEEMKVLKSSFDVELVVQCIRGTQNPQTHHHALILLSHAAYMLPEKVLHNTMEIFTFMGSSVLRHDDAYSFQIIIKIIETLIPILVKLDKNTEEYTEKELQQLQKRVVPVLRIFADVVLHVPEHRRLPLYKKLLETVGPSQFLWVFLGLLLETHIAHFDENKKPEKKQHRMLADQESPINRLDFGQNILLEFSPEICLGNFIKLVEFIRSLPLQKYENSDKSDVDAGDIFSVNGHTPIQLRHYKYVIITFMNSFLASSRFIHHASQAKDLKTMEKHYKTFTVSVLSFIQNISKVKDEKTAKYWKVMFHHSYDLLDHINSLLPAPMFVSVVRGLLKHTLPTVRRKAMELLNSKIQFNPEMFGEVDKELIYSLLPALLDIVKSIEATDDSLDENAAQELELNQQTALLSLKLLTRMLAAENAEPFKPVLEVVTEYTCNPNISGHVMASVVLCLAELSGNLKAHALSSLRKFMPALIKVLKRQRKAETPELVLLSTVTAIAKIVESLPRFLSPYLQKILYEYSILLAKWQNDDQECSKVAAIIVKLVNIRKKIASSIPPRVLIPVVNETHQLLLEKENYDAIGPVMAVLADCFANVTPADFTALQQDLTTFFLSALQLRSDAAEKNLDANVIDAAEDEIVKALVCLVLKLSESSFRPFYFKIYDWAVRSNVDGQKDRVITFYRVSSGIADKLKGLFVLFAGHFVKNAADLLDSCNNSKSETLYFDNEEKCITLLHYIIKTLNTVFLYDSQSFLNKDKFETLMQPIVDQLENTLGGVSSLKTRAAELLIPCITQCAVATADDSLWKLLNYQILLKTRHNDAELRLIALDCLVAMAFQLGSSWLPLLAESVPFLAELLEDGDSRIEVATKDAIRKLEQILGEPLEKYF